MSTPARLPRWGPACHRFGRLRSVAALTCGCGVKPARVKAPTGRRSSKGALRRANAQAARAPWIWISACLNKTPRDRLSHQSKRELQPKLYLPSWRHGVFDLACAANPISCVSNNTRRGIPKFARLKILNTSSAKLEIAPFA